MSNIQTETKMRGNTQINQDPRHPLYVGSWKRSIPNKNKGFARENLDEPHIKRRLAILAKHPEIEELYSYDKRTQLVSITVNAIQIGCAMLFGLVWTETVMGLIICSYLIGATINQMIGVILHECCHGLVARSYTYNKIFGIFSNTCLPFPIAMSFRIHHLDHHAYQGIPGKDPDLPLSWELDLVKATPIHKFIWLFFYPAMYVIRGAAFGKTLSSWEIVNIVYTLSMDYFIFRIAGARALLYMVVSMWLGYGIHPAAAHFIQEHYTSTDGQETYSYYGSFNKLFLNVGYHNEHHDFPKVPWSNLPTVKSIASEFYVPLKSYSSWFKVMWMLIFDNTLAPQSRVSRSHEDHKAGRRMIKFPSAGRIVHEDE